MKNKNKEYSGKPVILWIGTAIAGGVSLASYFLNQSKQKKADEKARQAAKVQYDRQRELNQQGQELGMKTWDETNYSAQMNEMEKAGLNPALMYGKSGAPATMSSPSGGSAGKAEVHKPYDVAGTMNAGLGAAQLSLLGAQKENIDADTENKKAGAGKLHEEGKGKFLDNVVKEWEMGSPGERELVKVVRSSTYGKAGMTDTSLIGERLEAEASTMGSNATIAEVEAGIRNASSEEELAGRIAEYIGIDVKNQLMKEDIDLKSEQGRKIYHDIIQGYINAGLKGLDSIVKAGIVGKIPTVRSVVPTTTKGIR